MTNKMKMLIGLLVLGIALLGVGVVFLTRAPQPMKVKLTPAAGIYLYTAKSDSSKVLLKTVKIEKNIADKQYFGVWGAKTINTGDPLLILSGTVQNNHATYKEIIMYAEGYDKTGKQIAWTYDASGIVGQIGLHLETGEIGTFTIHLNFDENITSIRIFADNYAVTPP